MKGNQYGHRFGGLILLELADPGKCWDYVRARCDCGQDIITQFELLRRGDITYCGAKDCTYRGENSSKKLTRVGTREHPEEDENFDFDRWF